MTIVYVVLTVLNVLVYVGAGVGALLASKRDKRAAVLMLVGCVLLVVGYGIHVGAGYSAASIGFVGGVSPVTLVSAANILGSLILTGGWCLILFALFAGGRRRGAHAAAPQPAPAQAWQAAPNAYGPPQPGNQPPPYGQQPPQQPYGPPPGPPPNPYGG